MPARHCFQYASTYSVAGSGFRAAFSTCSNSERRLDPRWRVTRLLICSTQSRMGALSSGSVKDVRLRILGMAHRVAAGAPASTFALSLGFLGRAGTIAVL